MKYQTRGRTLPGTERKFGMAVKYVFVLGGVVSGLGKGITAASLGRLLKARITEAHGAAWSFSPTMRKRSAAK